LFRLVSPSKADYEEKIWDHAAGALIVEEAGGRVSDLRGQPLDFGQGRTLKENIGVVVSNGQLHEIALACLREVGADRRPESV
jgi:3'(2'), 5'-bisphosphate nucleotidase